VHGSVPPVTLGPSLPRRSGVAERRGGVTVRQYQWWDEKKDHAPHGVPYRLRT
jgi:hypothetical protein